MKLTILIIIFIASFAISFLGYWLAGNDFQRDNNLAGTYVISLFISGVLIITYFAYIKGGFE
jgi:hypothetical protein